MIATSPVICGRFVPASAANRMPRRHRSATRSQVPNRLPWTPRASRPDRYGSTASTSASSPVCGTTSRVHRRPSVERHTSGWRATGFRAGTRLPTATYPPGTAATPVRTLSPVASDSRAGSASTSPNRTPSTDVHTAAPASPLASVRAPPSSHPSVPATSGPTPICSGPPNSSNADGTSVSGPGAVPIQVLVRRFPCTPPGAEPTATTVSPRQATVDSRCRGPYADLGCTVTARQVRPSTVDHSAGVVVPSGARYPPAAYPWPGQLVMSRTSGRPAALAGSATSRQLGPGGGTGPGEVGAQPATRTSTAAPA